MNGCTATPSEAEVLAADLPPPDFTLSMTVISKIDRRNTAAIKRERRPSRFVIETDWILRAFSGRGQVDAETFPRETRQLTIHEIQSIWKELREAGVLDPANPAIAGRAPMLSEVTANQPVWVITYSAADEHRTLVYDADPAGPAAPLLNRLADLAWMPK